MFDRARLSLFLIPAAVLVFMLPALLMGGGGSDLIYHLLWQEHFSRQFWQGELYPRWLYDMNAGCGSPTFYYYPPLPYYLGALFAFLNTLHPTYWYPLVVVGSLVLTAAGLAVYFWLRTHTGHFAALWASVIYIFLPYSAVAFYGSFLYSYFFALLWAPLLLLLVDRLFAGKPHVWLWIALAFAGLFLSNIPAAIVVAPLPFLYVALMKSFHLRHGMLLLSALALGAMLAAIYLLPMWTLKPEVYVAATNLMWEGTGDYHRGLFFTPESLSFSEVYILLTLSMCAMAFCVLLICREIQKHADAETRRRVTRWAIFFFAVFCLYFPFSIPLWEMLPMLKVIQMPSRLMVLSMLAFTALCAFLIQMKQAHVKQDVIFWHILLIGCALLMPLHASYSFFTRYDVNDPETVKHSKHYSRKILFYPYASLPGFEYLPKRVPFAYFSWDDAPAGLERLKAKCQPLTGQAEPEVPVKVNKISEQWHISLPMTAVKTAVTMPLFCFPGWSAFSGVLPVPVTCSQKGWLVLDVPPSKSARDIVLRRVSTPHERLGGMISAAAALIWLLLRFRPFLHFLQANTYLKKETP